MKPSRGVASSAWRQPIVVFFVVAAAPPVASALGSLRRVGFLAARNDCKAKWPAWPAASTNASGLAAAGRELVALGDARERWRLHCQGRSEELESKLHLAEERLVQAGASLDDLTAVLSALRAQAQEIDVKNETLIASCLGQEQRCGGEKERIAAERKQVQRSLKSLPAKTNTTEVQESLRRQIASLDNASSQSIRACASLLSVLDDQAEANGAERDALEKRLSFKSKDEEHAIAVKLEAQRMVDELGWRQGNATETCDAAEKYASEQLEKLHAHRADALSSGAGAALVDCGVAAWRLTAACSKTCGGGGARRVVREVTRAAAGGGAPCSALLEATIQCGQVPCPRACSLSAWGTWSACSAPCGQGLRSRRRAVETQPAGGGTPCGLLSEIQNCTGATRSSCGRGCKL